MSAALVARIGGRRVLGLDEFPFEQISLHAAAKGTSNSSAGLRSLSLCERFRSLNRCAKSAACRIPFYEHIVDPARRALPFGASGCDEDHCSLRTFAGQFPALDHAHEVAERSIRAFPFSLADRRP